MIDLSLLTILAKNEVVRTLQFDLVIDATMMKFLERIMNVSFLRSQGVRKIYKLTENLISDCSQIVYFLPPIAPLLRIVIDHIKRDKRTRTIRKCAILFYPNRTFAIDYILERECIMSDDVIVDNLNFYFIPLENNLISFEQGFYYRDMFVQNSRHPLECIASSMMVMMNLFGVIPLVYSVGEKANELCELIKLGVVSGNIDPEKSTPTIGRLLIVDRNMDMITPCLSQVSYEGLLADTFGIKSGFMEANDSELLKKLPPNSKKILLSDKNLIYCQIRNMQLSQVFQYLRDELSALHELQSKGSKIATVSDMKQFVSTDLRVIQSKRSSIITHITYGEAVMKEKERTNFSDRLYIEEEILRGKATKEIYDYIENEIVMQRPLEGCLALICLWCLCSRPSPKAIHDMKRIFYQSYGYHHLLTFDNLEKSGIIPVQSVQSQSEALTFDELSRELDLIPQDPENCTYPLDMGSVFRGRFRPLLCRVIESILDPHILQNYRQTSMGRRTRDFQMIPFSNISSEAQETVMLLFLGGVTHSELSAIKTIGINLGLRLFTATTSIMSGPEFMATFVP